MRKIIFILCLFCAQLAIGQWQNLNSGINDTLTDVVFFGDTGMVSGHNGLYYTLTGGDGNASWQRFEITDNSANSTLYNNTVFKACYAKPNNTNANFSIYAVGQNTVTNKAIIMEINFPTLDYNITSLDINNSDLVDIDYCRNFSRFYAVGNAGLVVYFSNDITNNTILNTQITNDLTSISFNYSGYRARLGSINEYFFMTTAGHTYTSVPTPNETHKDIAYKSNSFTYSVNENYIRFNYGTKIIISEYDYGPLNGNTIYTRSGYHFIGTDHGIFKSNQNETLLEWQPSSLNHNINSLWNASNEVTMYACGTNGVILKNDAPNDATKPYVRILFDGDCLSAGSSNIDAVFGTSDSCSWYINNTLVSTNCDDINYNFDTAGIYEVKLVLNNDGLITEDVKNVHIVNPPLVDKPFSILDTILCKEESLEITINNTEPDVKYTLKKVGTNASYGTSDVGNGGTLVFNSELINETGTFYLESSNVYAPSCTRSFTNTFDIIVEQTKADFHVDLINATTNEDVNFYENTIEADTFNWSFTNANTQTSTDPNPINSFNTSGIHDVSLTATSANLCVDDFTTDSPNIYDEPSDDQQCWSYLNVSDSPAWNGGYTPDISHITKVSDGYLTGGYYRNNSFGSNHGVGKNIIETGAYLTKHDFKGTLKWWVRTEATISSDRSLAMTSVEDLNGNIYVTLNDESCTFYDNSGQEIFLNSGGSIIKLDARGKLIWYMSIRTFNATGLKIDNDNNLIIYGTYDIYNDYQHRVRLNGVEVDEVGTIIFPDSGYRYCNAIIKATPDGTILWDNEIFSTSGTFGTSAQVREIGIDQNNNYYVQGRYKNHMYIYHTGSTDYTYLDFHQYNPGGSQYTHLLKFDADGALQWTTRSYTTNAGDYRNITANDSETDENGNTYLTGSNNYGPSTQHVHTAENADGSLYTSQAATTYFIKKINANGYCEWLVGADQLDGSLNSFTKGYELDLNNNEIKILGTVNPNIETPQNIEFKSLNDDNITVPLDKNNIFVNSYSLDGILYKVTVFEDPQNPYNRAFYGFFANNSNEYYACTNIGTTNSSSENDGRLNYYNDTCAVIYNNSLSVDEYDRTSVALYPNPTSGKITLKADQNFSSCQIKVHNLLGQIISDETHTYQNDISINIDGDSGIYFVELIFDGKIKTTKKIIKQ
ncbi:T9SS type A sorting domain-containing protein [Kordia sp.]|uniref:T9SS type A sorting domain-containing protein n=1 Tax=Kordia sp. TaxID=1965332 RepID=UPI003B590C4F